MNSAIVNGCDHAAAAAVNGIYQGIVIAALVGLGLRALGRTNAATRHAIWFATLVLLAFLIPAHCLLDCLAAARPASASIGHSETVGAPPEPAPLTASFIPVESAQPGHPPVISEDFVRLRGPGESGSLPALPDSHVHADGDSGPPGSEPAKAHSELPNVPLATEPVQSKTASSPPKDTIEEKSALRARQFPRAISWTLTPGSSLPRIASFVLLSIWLGVGSVKISLLLWRLCQLRKLKAEAVPAGSGLEELFQRLQLQVAVKRNVKLKISSMHRSPVLLGFFHPVVLLPAGKQGEMAETEAILRHELAHVRRRDDWVNLAQHLIQALLFFHPAVWWISRQLSIQREIACDDYVLQQGGRPRAYALLLADLASRIKTGRPLLALGVTTSKSQLQERIDMILNPHRDTSPRLAKSRLGLVTSTAALLAAVAIYAAPRLVLAQAQHHPRTTSPALMLFLPAP